MWRVSVALPHGLHLWFDPGTEFPRLFELEPGAERRVRTFSEGDDYESDPGVKIQDNELLFQEELPF